MPFGWVLVVRVVVRVPVMGFVEEVSETRAGCLCVPRRRDMRPGLRAVVVVFAERVRAMMVVESPSLKCVIGLLGGRVLVC